MKKRSVIGFVLALALLVLTGCPGNEPVYPDVPEIDYQGYSLYASEDLLGNPTLVMRISFGFTDGDGNLGLAEIIDSSFLTGVDTLDYNFFLQLYDYQEGDFKAIDEDKGGFLKYRIPYLNNPPLVGTIDLDVDFPVIVYDTIFFSFYIFDRDLQRSNTDSTDVVVLSDIDLEDTDQ